MCIFYGKSDSANLRCSLYSWIHISRDWLAYVQCTPFFQLCHVRHINSAKFRFSIKYSPSPTCNYANAKCLSHLIFIANANWTFCSPLFQSFFFFYLLLHSWANFLPFNFLTLPTGLYHERRNWKKMRERKKKNWGEKNRMNFILFRYRLQSERSLKLQIFLFIIYISKYFSSLCALSPNGCWLDGRAIDRNGYIDWMESLTVLESFLRAY